MPQPVSVTLKQTNRPARASGCPRTVGFSPRPRWRCGWRAGRRGHGVAGVDGQVQQHLLHHAGVGLDHRRRLAVIQLQRHVLAQKPAEHVRHVADDFVHVQLLGLDELAAAEGEQLPRQPGGAFGGLGDLLGGFSRRLVRLAAAEQRGVALNDGENVVEIVRDAAGELADGFHLLRLAQLLLQLPLRRDVAEQTQHQQRPLVDLDERVNDFQCHGLAIVQNVLAFGFALGAAG